MNKIKNMNRKLITLILVLMIAASNLVGLAFAKSNQAGEKTVELAGNGIQEAMPIVPDQSEDLDSVVNVVYDPQNEAVISQNKFQSNENRMKRLHREDQFNYSKKDIEELLLGGATVEDIYASDKIGNEWLINPKDLIELKKQGNQSWEDMETEVKKEKENQLAVLLTKNPKLEIVLGQSAMNTAEKLALVQAADQKGEASMKQIMAAYASEGLQGLSQLHDITINPDLDHTGSVPDHVYQENQFPVVVGQQSGGK
ncbi:hypothetical protein ACFOLF_21255 [Paenibacillus sepulcri]|uniref:Uncharacterized protein n=1 Tax=Paenibacillus sepulcri TaxID=359917 RepID=A0ABS7BWL8_9BACL|nr:hypothetical protein [Paenibacillus sepulcri]